MTAYLPMTDKNLFPVSHQQIIKTHTGGRSLLCPHRYRTVNLSDRNPPEVSLSKICITAPCNCYTFCQTFLAPCLYFNTGFRYFLARTSHIREAGISWRVRIVAPHIPHVLYAFVYEIVKVHPQAPACILDKINSGLISP